MKQCRVCFIEKPYSSYYGHNQAVDGYRGECKSCTLNKAKERAGKPQHRAARARWCLEYNKSPGRLTKLKEYNLKQYGITMEQYSRLLEAQLRKCKICGVEHSEEGKKKRLHVDHCHKTGKIRGLLCNKCNSLLGFAKDDLGVLDKAISYLRGAI